MKNTKNIILLTLCAVLFLAACDKPTEFRKYYNYGQNQYPGIVTNLHAYGGLNRLLLIWGPQVDPSVVKYVIYWDNGGLKDSLTYTPQSGNTGMDSVFINNLSETNTYVITIYSYDAKGNRSVPVELQNAVVYGSIFSANLSNRHIAGYNYYYQNDTAYISWAAADSTNVGTKVTYTDNSGSTKSVFVDSKTTSLKLPGIKPLSTLYYQSGAVPVVNSPDTIYAAPDSLTVVYDYSGTYAASGSQHVLSANGSADYGTYPYNLGKTVTKTGENTYAINIIADNGAVFGLSSYGTQTFTVVISPDNAVTLSGSCDYGDIFAGNVPSTFDPNTLAFKLTYGLNVAGSYELKYATETLVIQ